MVCLSFFIMSNNPEKFANEQNDVTGQRKEVDVESYPSAIESTNVLKDVNYPADKKSIINSIDHNKTDKKIIDMFRKKLKISNIVIHQKL